MRSLVKNIILQSQTGKRIIFYLFCFCLLKKHIKCFENHKNKNKLFNAEINVCNKKIHMSQNCLHSHENFCKGGIFLDFTINGIYMKSNF